MTEGDTVTFSVTMTNSATLLISYPWRWGPLTVDIQTNLNQYSSTYTLTDVQLTDASDYTVVVTNTASYLPGILINPATLEVLPE